MSTRRTALLAILFVSFLWGTAGVVAKVLMRELSPAVVLVYRFGLSSLLLLPWFLRTKKPAHAWQTLLFPSLLSAGNPIFFYIGLTRTTASSASVIGASAPLVTAVFAHVLIKEHISKGKITGILIGLIGALVIILLPVWQTGQSLGGDLWGNLLIVGAVLCWTLYTVWSRHILTTNPSITPLVMTEAYFLALTAAAGIWAISSRSPFITPGVLTPGYLAVLAYSTVAMTAVTFGLFQWAIKHVSASTASFKDYIQLVIGVIIAMLALGEPINLQFALGSLIVISGISVATGSSVYRRAKQQLGMIR